LFSRVMRVGLLTGAYANRQSYREAEGDDAKHIAMALIADLQQRYNIAVEARRQFMKP
jgi:hypothetical protein